MVKKPYCRNCGHPAHRADCGVDDRGCVRYEPRPSCDPEKLRTWIVRAAFLVRNRCVEAEVRVKAGGLVGALSKGVREAKRQTLKPNTRVLQTKATVIPVRGGKRAEWKVRILESAIEVMQGSAVVRLKAEDAREVGQRLIDAAWNLDGRRGLAIEVATVGRFSFESGRARDAFKAGVEAIGGTCREVQK